MIPLNSHRLRRLATNLGCLAVCSAAQLALHAATAETNLTAGPSNPGFEQGEIGEVPSGWFVPGVVRGAGYKAEVTTEGAQSGERCVVLSREKGTVGNPNIFGNLMQVFDAKPFRGKRVRFRAAVRVEPDAPTDHAQLWLRVDRTGQQLGFFDNMGDRPITSTTWSFYEISGNIEEDAERINVGLMLLGGGKAFLDSITFETTAQRSFTREKPRPLTERGMQNLVAFTRLLGYVRHFHPSDEAAATDWNTFVLRAVKTIESATNAPELATMLQALFQPIAPTVRVFIAGQHASPPPLQTPPSGKTEIVYWRHLGFGGGNSPPGQNIYSSQRIHEPLSDGKAPANQLDPGKPFEADLGGGAACLVPLALYADPRGTLPRAAQVEPKTEDQKLDASDFSGNDRATRLADVALAWNVFQHFYPYFDNVHTDWPQALRQALTTAATDAGERAFLNTLRRLVAALHDGHARAQHRCDNDFATPPLKLVWVEDQLVIKDAIGEAAKIKPGDILRKIDGRPAQELLLEREELISGATPQWKRWRSVTELFLGPEGSSVTLELQRGTEAPFTLSLKRSGRALSDEKRPEKIHEIKKGVWYVDLDARQANLKDFQAALPDLEQADGIIFDLRGYPNDVAIKVLPLLTDKPITSAQWCVPIITFPDRQHWDFKLDRWPPFGPESPRLKAKIAFLTDGRAISYAESILGIVEYYKLGEIVGEPTAGTNGNVNPVALPGGYSLMWTGMKVLKHDGSTHHGIGIRPTVQVSPTIRGVAQGRVEVLEKAVEIVEAKK